MTSEAEIPKPTRREMLYYLGGASILLLAGEVVFGLSKFINAPDTPYGIGMGGPT